MKRAFTVAAAILAGTFALNACARAPDSASAASALAKWQAGTNYTLLPTPQPTSVAAGKIEIDEVFWYGCGHCFALEPTLENWKSSKAPYIEFVHVPVIWGPTHRQHAKLFYTLQALGRGDLHPKVFDAIHREGKQLAAATDEGARALHMAFLKEQGISEKDFNAAYDSMSVAMNLQKAEKFTQTFAIDSVPTMVVNGKYKAGVSQAGGPGELMSLINDLAASEKSR
jgi:thiol:disulfide interchange protein DsbA